MLSLNVAQQVAYGLRFYGLHRRQPEAVSEGWSAAAAKLTARTLGAEVDASVVTGSWLLRWYTDLDDDPAILLYARRLGDSLIASQYADGTFPTAIDATEVSALFLAQLAQLTGDGSYMRALVRTCDALMRSLGSVAMEAGVALLKTYRLSGDQAHLEVGLQLAEAVGTMDDAGAELCAEAYRLTMQPGYAEEAVRRLRCQLPKPYLPPNAGLDALKGLARWAVIEANYPDILSTVP